MTAVKRKLVCELTEDEIAQRSMTSATAMVQYEQVDAQKKTTLSQLTAKLKELRSVMKINSDAATTGQEERAVDCMWTLDRPNRRALLIRQDTYGVVEERELRSSEMQLTIDDLITLWFADTSQAPPAGDEEVTGGLKKHDDGDEEQSDDGEQETSSRIWCCVCMDKEASYTLDGVDRKKTPLPTRWVCGGCLDVARDQMNVVAGAEVVVAPVAVSVSEEDGE
jgi:hypothetical protein